MSIDFYYFFLLIALASFTFLRHKQSHTRKKRYLPPGKMGLPWLGETMEFFNAQRRNRLFEDFVSPEIRKHGKIFKTRLMGSPTVIVNGSKVNRFFLSNEFKLVKSSWPSSSVQLMGKNSIMEKDIEKHRSLRGIMGLSFGYLGLEILVPRISRSVALHLERQWKNSGQRRVQLHCSTKCLTLKIVFECLLGMEVEEGMVDSFERVLEGVFSAGVMVPGSRFWRVKRARREIQRRLERVVREKKREMEGGRGKRNGCF